MPLRKRLFNKVTIIGVGLIGGSLGMAIKKKSLAREVVGLSQRHATLVTALKNEAIDHGYHDVRKAVTNADLVILATPVSIVIGMISLIAPYLKRNCIVTDVGSSKTHIVEAAQKQLKNASCFVGSHPLVGSEKKGVQFAEADLFQGALCMMTPTDSTSRMARDRIKRLWTALGSHIKFISPMEHDRILAFISHLPHVVAYALMEAVPADTLEFAAKGFKDTTRIASSTPQMWSDICVSNPKNIIKGIDEVVKYLSGIRKAIGSKNTTELMNHFKSAKAKRDKIK